MVFFLLDLKVENLEPGLIQQINTYTVTWTNETTDNSHLIRSLTINGQYTVTHTQLNDIYTEIINRVHSQKRVIISIS